MWQFEIQRFKSRRMNEIYGVEKQGKTIIQWHLGLLLNLDLEKAVRLTSECCSPLYIFQATPLAVVSVFFALHLFNVFPYSTL